MITRQGLQPRNTFMALPPAQDFDGSLRDSISWGADGFPIAHAREAVRALLTRAGHPAHTQTSQDAQLVVSELVTNALRHAPGPGRLELGVTADAQLLRIRVRDSSPQPPQPQERDTTRPRGHGLFLATLLCTDLRTTTSDSGKDVTADFPLTPH
ncbi:ATP-binding protein [Streptomyces sp. NPDC056670]|uniref:ATP-binding protein n=1 Tax=Streptomyces sp. NPDC056670 TaxID=3345904 RepID=UPI0036C37D26